MVQQLFVLALILRLFFDRTTPRKKTITPRIKKKLGIRMKKLVTKLQPTDKENRKNTNIITLETTVIAPAILSILLPVKSRLIIA